MRILMGLALLGFFALCPVVNAYDIVGKDDRKPLTAKQKVEFQFVGRLHVGARWNTGEFKKLPRCILTLIEKDVAITSADCLVMSTQIGWKKAIRFKTVEEYQSHVAENSRFYAAVFQGEDGNKISVGIRSLHFAASFRPGSKSPAPDRKFLFNSKPPSGTDLVAITLEKPIEITPVEIRASQPNQKMIEARLVSVLRGNKTFMLTPSCGMSDLFQDRSRYERGLSFFHNCDVVGSLGAPLFITLLLEGGKRKTVLYGIDNAGLFLGHLLKENPNMSEDRIFNLWDQSCGELSEKCGNIATSSDEILKLRREANL